MALFVFRDRPNALLQVHIYPSREICQCRSSLCFLHRLLPSISVFNSNGDTWYKMKRTACRILLKQWLFTSFFTSFQLKLEQRHHTHRPDQILSTTLLKALCTLHQWEIKCNNWQACQCLVTKLSLAGCCWGRSSAKGQLCPCELEMMRGGEFYEPCLNRYEHSWSTGPFLEMTPLKTLKVLKGCQKQWIAVILELRAKDNTSWSCFTPMLWIFPKESLICISRRKAWKWQRALLDPLGRSRRNTPCWRGRMLRPEKNVVNSTETCISVQ